MKTAVIGEGTDGSVVYNPSLVALLDHCGSAPRACKAYRAKTKGKVERPFRTIRQDFFLDRTFRSLDDLNAQFDAWLREVANPRLHATTGRIVDDAFAEEQGSLIALPAHPYDPVLTVERRVSRDGMVSVGGNLYSVPDAARKRVLSRPRQAAFPPTACWSRGAANSRSSTSLRDLLRNRAYTECQFPKRLGGAHRL